MAHEKGDATLVINAFNVNLAVNLSRVAIIAPFDLLVDLKVMLVAGNLRANECG